MSSFAGVSVVTDGKLCTTSAVDAGTDSGYHLLVVKDYPRTVREVPNGEVISSEPFKVGGHQWDIWYYPRGNEPNYADFISLFVRLADEDIEDGVEVKAQFEISFVDAVEKQKPKCIRASEACIFSTKKRLWGYNKFMRRYVLERSGNLKDDCFTIRCDVMVCKDHSTEVVVDGSLSADGVDEQFDYLLKNKVGADVTFEVGGETFAAHRCVLAARSKVFMAQLFGPMAEGTTSSVINIKDMDPKVFDALLSFIYTGSFPWSDKEMNKGEDEEEESEDEESVEDVMWLHDLLVAADRYDLQRLKFLCENELSEEIGVCSVASTLALAEQHHRHRLKEACFKFIQVQSPSCLEKVMASDGWKHLSTTYPDVLKELISKLASNQRKGRKRMKH